MGWSDEGCLTTRRETEDVMIGGSPRAAALVLVGFCGVYFHLNLQLLHTRVWSCSVFFVFLSTAICIRHNRVNRD